MSRFLLPALALASTILVACGDDESGLPGREEIVRVERITRTASADGLYTFSIRLAIGPDTEVKYVSLQALEPDGDQPADFTGISSIQLRVNGDPVSGARMRADLVDVTDLSTNPVNVSRITNGQLYALEPLDLDGDGIENRNDNCATQQNSDQADFDSDGIGDLCDPEPQTAQPLDAREAFDIGLPEVRIEWVVSVNDNLLPPEGIRLRTAIRGEQLISDQ